MTQSVQSIIDAFDHLAESEKREAFTEILRRVRMLHYEAPSDEELVLTCEGLFLDLDQNEMSDGQP